MKKHWKPILTLMVLAPILTEVVSGSTPAPLFFTPGPFIFLVTIGYGLPILIIREVALRRNFGLVGLIFLGFIYGIYNEGLLAKTIFDLYHSPIETFAIYGLVGNLRVPWALVIAFWHAFYAVISPIIFVEYLFPSAAKESWIGKKVAWVLGFICVSLGTWVFLGAFGGNLQGEVSGLIVICVIWAVLTITLGKLPTTPRVLQSREITPLRWKKYVCLGLTLNLVLFLIPVIISGVPLPPYIFATYFIAATTFLIWKALRIPGISSEKMVLIGLGGMIANTSLVFIKSFLSNQVMGVVSSLVFLIIFAIATLIVIQKRILSAMNH